MQLSSDVFNNSVQYLENHQESLRIRKLIFCLAKKSWENDPNILNSYSLKELILELVQIIPNRDQLKLSLYKLVKSLNRPKVYAPVAKIIFDQIDYIYRDSHQDNDFLEEVDVPVQSTHITNKEFLLEQAVESLNKHEQSERIKKLIFALSREQWENNLDQINSHGLKNLISELLQKYPNRADLEIAFNQLIGKINKRNLYLAISKVILTKLEAFYEDLSVSIDAKNQTIVSSYSTQIIPLNNINYTPNQSGKNNQFQDLAFDTSVIDITSEQMKTEIQQIRNSVSVPPPPAPKTKTYDIFELRLQIVQYTNPLQAKILLFSLLFHPWDRSGQDWSMLRSYTLDDLLEQLLQSGKPLAEIESKLYTAAKSLKDHEPYLQAASTLVETIKPFV
ncbi:conserved hypothetical protein [Rippkaea orientalis PCC 8801]|uniref:Uncharacterized protein n=1 Tax=Rippkaea orientalis (strain PCC 8801 / RF-1) TaxID=41431 RepID=B7JZK8_RIPO1|nr:hypothetical protein [Rippkaea orientalis]ACK64951.1 conserved hypothetical protein [Rippkaea orientalis PCC 8801]